MGLFNSVISDVVGGNTASASTPIASILSELLEGGQAGTPASPAGSVGRLAGLVSQFEGAGLGNLAQSWINNGQQNQPVSPQQLQTVLGPERVQGMAQKAGLQPQDLLTQLSQHLPNVIDCATPTGQLPSQASMSV